MLMKSLIALAVIVVVLVAVVAFRPSEFRVARTVMDMDKMIGGNFDNGLRDMKAVVETQPSGRSKG